MKSKEKMAGTKKGGQKAAKTNIEKFGKDFYREIGRKGGRNGVTGGFADPNPGKDGLTGPERAKYYGRIGGTISRRGKSKKATKGIEYVQD
jgi:general stress protein YciG